MPEVKFCGITREDDARYAAELGAAYAGVIFAGGPREIAPAQAARVFAAAGSRLRRVGVFGRNFGERLSDVLAATPLDVVQLHADPTVEDVRVVRARFTGAVWAAVRVVGAEIPAVTVALMDEADAVLLDPKVPGALGGTGTPMPWSEIAERLATIRGDSMLVLAGGLTAGNVEEAICALDPDVVDVSSGVESAPGVKDRERMAAFAEAARRVRI